jgi:calcineurin-like phosphoesterase family protein
MSRDYFVADLHFFHKNILLHETLRPFESLFHMHKELIKNWNNAVSKKARVWVLGDFSFGNKEQTRGILQQLNGEKILIPGNHDRRRTRTWWLNVGFDRVIQYPIIYKNEYVLSHEPINTGLKNIHGHLHSKEIHMRGFVCVSVEQTAFKPISFHEVEKRMNNKGDD